MEDPKDLLADLLKRYQKVSKQRVHLMAWVAAFLSVEKDDRIKSLKDLKLELVSLISNMIDSDAMVKDKIDLHVAELAKIVCEQEQLLNLFNLDKNEEEGF